MGGQLRLDSVARQRLDAMLRSPSLGPALLFFSGGTALRPLSRQLKRYTHNSIHLITPFDSGGSSAELRRAFAMPAVGDLRNRLVALADETSEANAALYRLFCHRLPKQVTNERVSAELAALATGEHELVLPLPEGIRKTVCDTLGYFLRVKPQDFMLQGANVGNLLLTGVYLSHGREIGTALLFDGRMLGVKGIVKPTSELDAHLAVRLKNGQRVVGQHRITGKEAPALDSPIEDLFLTAALNSEQPIEVSVTAQAREMIAEADLICYAYGSFYSSVLANLLPQGVGHAIASVRCPKVYVPNWGTDPEQLGMSLSQSVERLLTMVRRDAPQATGRQIIERVLIDTRNLHYALELDVPRVRQLGVEVMDVPFGQHQGDEVDFVPLTELLLSLS